MDNFEDIEGSELVEQFKKNIDENMPFYYDSSDIEEIIDLLLLASDPFYYVDKALDYAIKTFPEESIFRINKVRRFLFDMDIEKAREEFKKIEEDFVPAANIYIMKLHLARLNFEKIDAIEILKKALRLEPENPEVLFLLGVEYACKNDVEPAVECAKAAIGIEEMFHEQLFSYSTVFEENKKYESGQKFFEALSEDFPLLGGIWMGLGLTYDWQNEHQKAIDVYQLALSCSANIPAVHFNMGNSYFEMKQYDKALECYFEANQLDPDDFLTLSFIGDCFSMQNWQEEALEYYRKALDLNQFHDASILGIAEIYKKRGKLVEAFQFLEKITIEHNYSITHLFMVIDFFTAEDGLDKDKFGEILVNTAHTVESPSSFLKMLVTYCLMNDYLETGVLIVEKLYQEDMIVLDFAEVKYFLAAFYCAMKRFDLAKPQLEVALLENYEGHVDFLDLDPRIRENEEAVLFINKYRYYDEN